LHAPTLGDVVSDGDDGDDDTAELSCYNASGRSDVLYELSFIRK